MSNLLARFDRVLRTPDDLVSDDPEQLRQNAADLVLVTLVGAAAWGLVVGSYRGGLQLVWAPIKAPLIFLLPLGVCLPALRALLADDPSDLPAARLASATLAGAARAAVLCAATAPLLWLLYGLPLGYEGSLLWTVALAAPPTAAGMAVVTRALDPSSLRVGAQIAGLALLALVTLQTSWLLRPFLAHPQREVTFLRAVEDDAFTSIADAAWGCDAGEGCEGLRRGQRAGLIGRGAP